MLLQFGDFTIRVPSLGHSKKCVQQIFCFVKMVLNDSLTALFCFHFATPGVNVVCRGDISLLFIMNEDESKLTGDFCIF